MEFQSVSISGETSIKDTLRFLDLQRSQFVVITKDGFLIGFVTDGDIRRSLIRGIDLHAPVSQIMNINPISLNEDHGMSQKDLVRLLNKLKIRAIPIVDTLNRLKSIITLDELLSDEDLGISALIMAGGKGERLKPITTDTPKPLIQLGSQSLIERTIYRLSAQNIKQIYIAVHHQKEKFFKTLDDGSKYGVSIKYLEEEKPLGTAGAISLIPNLHNLECLLVTNADLIHDIDYRTMLEHHRSQDSDLTISVSHYLVKIPYGVVRYKNNEFISIDEKPSYEYPIMCGVNILGKRMLESFSNLRRIDMVETIEYAQRKNLNVKIFFSDGHWVDVGDLDTLRKEMSYFRDSD